MTTSTTVLERPGEQPNELYELQETLYTSKNPTRRWLHRSRSGVVKTMLETWGEGTHGVALEVGPGSGVYLPTLTRVAREVVASDIENDYLSELRPYARKHPNLRLERDDITRSCMPSDFFDLILCSEVVEHIRDSQCALNEIYRMLQPGGLLLLTTPQRYSPLELIGRVAFLPGAIRLVRRIYREPILPTGHVNLMTEREVRAQLERAGFTVESVYKTGAYIPLLAETLCDTALRIERRFESAVRGTRWDWLLWTQYFLARKPGALSQAMRCAGRSERAVES
jgi:2-polyprenyl-3-methyl-5-hydroxy-6-metoxy-1,4-benzoquinol methylase